MLLKGNLINIKKNNMDLNNKIKITESKMLRVPIRTIVKDIVEILKHKQFLKQQSHIEILAFCAFVDF